MLVIVVAQSCSLSSHISLVSFIRIAAVKAGIPLLKMGLRGLGIRERGWHINSAESGDGIRREGERKTHKPRTLNCFSKVDLQLVLCSRRDRPGTGVVEHSWGRPLIL